VRVGTGAVGDAISGQRCEASRADADWDLLAMP